MPKRVRFTIGHLMVAVAISAIVALLIRYREIVFALHLPIMVLACFPCLWYLGREVERSPKSTTESHPDRPNK